MINITTNDHAPYIKYIKNALEMRKDEVESKKDGNDVKTINLWEACKKGYLDRVKYLIEHGGKKDINQGDNDGWTPLHQACWQGRLAVLITLWVKGQIKIKRIIRGETPLGAACARRYKEIAKYLVSKGAKVTP